MAMVLEVQDLQKTFELHIRNGKRVHALSGIGFEIREGEVLGLAGKSGSGKSTLMKCVYRTYLPTSGSVIFHSTTAGKLDLATANEHEVLAIRRSEMTYCSQFLQVIPRVPALDVVAEPMLRRGVDREEAVRQVQRIFERLSLPQELWDGFPATFSGGEQQRVNIARAIVTKPRLLLLDEPTASLDLETKNAVIEMIHEIRSKGTSMLVITHDDYTMQKLAGRQLLLSDGKIAEAMYA
jgi:alpha-D-ribose 1-methylphosphonate 5-triphosphate synthase subunit PhnL